jgi:O-antigen ligase
MTDVDQAAPSGSRFRTAVLAAFILTLAAASFDNVAFSSAAYTARYVFASLLLLATYRQRDHVRTLSDHPAQARLLIRGAWLFAAVAWLSMMWSIEPRESALQAAVFTLLVANIHLHANRRWHDHADVIADFRVVFWALSATIIASATSGTLVGTRLAGVYDNPNSLGILAAFTAALGVGLFLEGRPAGRRGLVLIATLLALAALGGSQSRTAFVGILIAISICGLLMAARGALIPAAALVGGCFASAGALLYVTLGGAITLPSVTQRFSSSRSAGLFGEREAIWEYAIRLWEREPLTGYGFRAGEIIFARMEYLSGGAALGATFNSYLQILLELGYIGAIPLALTILGVIWTVLRSRYTKIQAGLSMLAVVGLASGVTESALFGLGSPISWVFWFAATAAAVAAQRPAEDVKGEESETAVSARTKGQGVAGHHVERVPTPSRRPVPAPR